MAYHSHSRSPYDVSEFDEANLDEGEGLDAEDDIRDRDFRPGLRYGEQLPDSPPRRERPSKRRSRSTTPPVERNYPRPCLVWPMDRGIPRDHHPTSRFWRRLVDVFSSKGPDIWLRTAWSGGPDHNLWSGHSPKRAGRGPEKPMVPIGRRRKGDKYERRSRKYRSTEYQRSGKYERGGFTFVNREIDPWPRAEENRYQNGAGPANGRLQQGQMGEYGVPREQYRNGRPQPVRMAEYDVPFEQYRNGGRRVRHV